jgi:hypothetical protein
VKILLFGDKLARKEFREKLINYPQDKFKDLVIPEDAEGWHSPIVIILRGATTCEHTDGIYNGLKRSGAVYLQQIENL